MWGLAAGHGDLPGSPVSPCWALEIFLCFVTENWLVFRT